MTKVRKLGGDLNLSTTMQNTNLPFNVQPLPKDHPYQIALKRHEEARGILEALNNIEACRIDALARSKKETPGTEQHSEVMAALAILSGKRREATQRYAQYYGVALTEIKKA